MSNTISILSLRFIANVFLSISCPCDQCRAAGGALGAKWKQQFTTQSRYFCRKPHGAAATHRLQVKLSLSFVVYYPSEVLIVVQCLKVSIKAHVTWTHVCVNRLCISLWWRRPCWTALWQQYLQTAGCTSDLAVTAQLKRQSWFVWPRTLFQQRYIGCINSAFRGHVWKQDRRIWALVRSQEMN